jgi:hypothetical protein
MIIFAEIKQKKVQRLQLLFHSQKENLNRFAQICGTGNTQTPKSSKNVPYRKIRIVFKVYGVWDNLKNSNRFL